MTDRLARALRALADRLSPPQPIVIHAPGVKIDGCEIARAVRYAAGANPSGVIETDGVVDDAAASELLRQWAAEHR